MQIDGLVLIKGDASLAGFGFKHVVPAQSARSLEHYASLDHGHPYGESLTGLMLKI